jgi:hypothetical protein
VGRPCLAARSVRVGCAARSVMGGVPSLCIDARLSWTSWP